MCGGGGAFNQNLKFTEEAHFQFQIKISLKLLIYFFAIQCKCSNINSVQKKFLLGYVKVFVQYIQQLFNKT